VWLFANGPDVAVALEQARTEDDQALVGRQAGSFVLFGLNTADRLGRLQSLEGPECENFMVSRKVSPEVRGFCSKISTATRSSSARKPDPFLGAVKSPRTKERSTLRRQPARRHRDLQCFLHTHRKANFWSRLLAGALVGCELYRSLPGFEPVKQGLESLETSAQSATQPAIHGYEDLRQLVTSASIAN